MCEQGSRNRGTGSCPLQAWTVSPKTLSSSMRATWFSPQASSLRSTLLFSPSYRNKGMQGVTKSRSERQMQDRLTLYAHLLLRSLEDNVCKELLRFNLNGITRKRT